MLPTLTLLQLLRDPSLASGVSSVPVYERRFAEVVLGDPASNCLAFWRGRVALWSILKSVGIGPGDQVVLPAYTCSAVPATIKLVGAECVYCDLLPGSFNMDVDMVKARLTPRTRAVICQHTFGLPQDVRSFRQLCDEQHLLLVEDCCQAIVGRDIKATDGDASFFSMQWNKPYSTGFGGMAVFKNVEHFEKAKALQAEFGNDDAHNLARSLTAQMLLYNLLARGITRELASEAYRLVKRLRFRGGTITTAKWTSEIPEDYFTRANNVQALAGVSELDRWQDNISHRMGLTEFYLHGLGGYGITDYLRDTVGSSALWAVPLLVENKLEVLKKCQWSGLPVQRWFDKLPPHVYPQTCRQYDYTPGQCPVSEQSFLNEIHLPTAPSVSMRQASKTVRFLKSYGDFTGR